MSETSKTFQQMNSLVSYDLDIACVLDGYEPRLAQMVTETIGEIKDENVITVMFAIWIDGAREEVSCN